MSPEVFQLQAITAGGALLLFNIAVAAWASAKGRKLASGAPFTAGLLFGTGLLFMGIAGLEKAVEWVDSTMVLIGSLVVIGIFGFVLRGEK